MLLDFDCGARQVFIAAAALPAGVFVPSRSASAATYEALMLAGAVEELMSPAAGFRVFRAHGVGARGPAVSGAGQTDFDPVLH